MTTDTTTAVTHPSALAVVQAVYEAFATGDTEAALALFHDDIEITQSDELPWGGTYRGKEGALSFFGTLLAHIQTGLRVDRFIVAGDTVVEVGKTCGHALATGRKFEIDEVHVWRVRDGRIDRLNPIVDNAAMLAAIAA